MAKGDDLAAIFKASGNDFGKMEVKVKQFVLEQETNRVEGGWHTDISLGALGWTSRLDIHDKSLRAVEADDYQCKGMGAGSGASPDQ